MDIDNNPRRSTRAAKPSEAIIDSIASERAIEDARTEAALKCHGVF